jgi:hypothetical protein
MKRLALILVVVASCKSPPWKKSAPVTKSAMTGSAASSAAGPGPASRPASSAPETGLNTGQQDDDSKTAFVDQVIDTQTRAAEIATPMKSAAPVDLPARAPEADQGDFRLVVDPGPDTLERKTVQQMLEVLVPVLNRTLKVPRDIPIHMTSCGQPNAFYNFETHEIQVCDEYAPSIMESFSLVQPDKQKQVTMAVTKLVQTLFHELGHCMIHEWHLPITGREEDAADQASMFFLLMPHQENTAQVALLGAEYWVAAEAAHGDATPYWDPHALDEQRFFNMMCLVFGSDPKQFSYLVDEGVLPIMRAANCKMEWAQVRDSWSQLLKPYVIAQGAAASSAASSAAPAAPTESAP